MLKRTIADTIAKISSAWPVLLLSGPRQAGKSSVLNMLKEKKRRYISLDDLSARELAQNDPTAFLQKYAPPVFIPFKNAPIIYSGKIDKTPILLFEYDSASALDASSLCTITAPVLPLTEVTGKVCV